VAKEISVLGFGGGVDGAVQFLEFRK